MTAPPPIQGPGEVTSTSPSSQALLQEHYVHRKKKRRRGKAKSAKRPNLVRRAMGARA